VGKDMHLGVVDEVEAAGEAVVEIKVILLTAANLKARETLNAEVEGAAGLHLRRIGRTQQQEHRDADNRGRAQQLVADVHP